MTQFYFTLKAEQHPLTWDDMREAYLPNSNWVKASDSYGDTRYGPNERGKLMHDVWRMPTINNMAKERTGSPDQKPLPLYERIIQASSNEGDIVLDPFCGCATTIIAARNLNRRWIGIDRRTDARYHVVCRMAGISAKDRKKLEQRPDLADWLQRQMGKYEAHYTSKPPVRTDAGDTAAPDLDPVYPVGEEYALTHKEMHTILIERFGLRWWGCDFEAPDERYLELDHVDPRSSGGSNDLDNRALLCRPCNQMKSSHLTLAGLWTKNRQQGYLTQRQPIDIQEARTWARQYLVQLIRETSHQLNLDGR